MKLDYRAPWGNKLKLSTAIFVAICALLAIGLPGWASSVVIGIVILGAAFSVRGFSLREGKLLVHRLGWATRIDLSDLEHVQAMPEATMGSIRTFGIGGLFAFVGYYRNEILGNYRAFATDSANAVVLDFGSRKIVVTPDEPESFAQSLQRLHPSVGSADSSVAAFQVTPGGSGP